MTSLDFAYRTLHICAARVAVARPRNTLPCLSTEPNSGPLPVVVTGLPPWSRMKCFTQPFCASPILMPCSKPGLSDVVGFGIEHVDQVLVIDREGDAARHPELIPAGEELAVLVKIWMRALERSHTNSRPRLSMLMQCAPGTRPGHSRSCPRP